MALIKINNLVLVGENGVFAASPLAQGKEDEEFCVFSDSLTQLFQPSSGRQLLESALAPVSLGPGSTQ